MWNSLIIDHYYMNPNWIHKHFKSGGVAEIFLDEIVEVLRYESKMTGRHRFRIWAELAMFP